MNQQQGVFTAINGQKNTPGTQAGVIPANVLAKFNKLKNHIFIGEKTSKTSGRHLNSVFLAANPGAKPQSTNALTKIIEYPNGAEPKTVWDDGPGGYTQLDVENMCAVAISLTLAQGKADGSFIVQTPFGTPACIRWFDKGTGSCFPNGSAAPRGVLGTAC